jgi:hypothetical protein
VTARGTVLLCLGLTGLVGTVALDSRHRVVPEAEQPPVLLASPEAVARIEIDEPRGRLAAVRTATGWTDETGRPWPREAPADLLGTLSTLRPIMVVDPAPDRPAEYGLGPGAEQLRVSAADGTPLLVLEVGERNPSWTGLYARRPDRPEVVLVGALLRWEIEKVRDTRPQE